MFQQRSRLARGRIDFRQPLTDHPLNVGRVAWWLPVPGRYGGNNWWDLAQGILGTFSGFTSSTYGFNAKSYPGGFGSVRFNGSSTLVNATAPVSWSSSSFSIIARFNMSAYPGGGNPATVFTQGQTEFQVASMAMLSTSSTLSFGFYSPEASISVSSSGKDVWLAGSYTAGSPGTLNIYAFVGNTFYSSSTTNSNGNYNGTYSCTLGGPPSALTFPWEFMTGYLYSLSLYNYALPQNLLVQDYYLGFQGYPGVLRRRRRVAYSVPVAGSVLPWGWDESDTALRRRSANENRQVIPY